MSGMATYTILLDPDPEDGGYTVTVPALPGCVTEGETVVEYIQNAEEAIRLYLDDLRASGEPVPEEEGRPPSDHRHRRRVEITTDDGPPSARSYAS